MKRLTATFQIKGSFHITGRGLVAIGDILSGKIAIGDTVSVDINGTKELMRITGVEMGDRISTGEYFVGLLLKSESDVNLTGVKLKPQMVEVLASVS